MSVRQLTLALCFLGATAADAQTRAPRTTADTITSARRAQNEMLRIGHLDSASTFWTDDIVVLAGLGARVDGRAALRAAFAQDNIVLYRREPEQVDVSAAWPIAFERGRWVGVLGSDTTVVLITGWYSARWLREGTRWRIQAEQFVANECHSVACAWPLAARRAAP